MWLTILLRTALCEGVHLRETEGRRQSVPVEIRRNGVVAFGSSRRLPAYRLLEEFHPRCSGLRLADVD